MPRRSQPSEPETIRKRLVGLLVDFEEVLKREDLRTQVRSLVPAAHALRDLGASLFPADIRTSASARILAYLRKYGGTVVSGDELMVVAGIGDYPRRIRELRREEGWPILSGVAAQEIRSAAGDEGANFEGWLPPEMRVDDYFLVEDRQDREAAHRWHMANRIRRQSQSPKLRMLAYLRENVGRTVTSEELRYVANNSDWARRVRELRTQDGWPVVTRQSGDPSLPVATYRLEEDRQAPPHDRNISELTRRRVLERDEWRCQWRGCGWSIEMKDRDPRFLEAHHIEHHAHGGSNEANNLVTLCNLHHDEAHRKGILDIEPTTAKMLGI